ncbi:MAG: CDF family Co(II)/Ni(II) efflux transporter DmeF [SAR324 cluster bacterium]|nr:CDF family Co(II)/Ni(II) efflux transporter DmeF [SAR324 cluster bacterium]
MHIHTIDQWKHPHQFNIENSRGERNTAFVIVLTVSMMVIEVSGGLFFGSMALLADGWHMGSHATALGITIFAYRFARHHADDSRFTFGTGKVGALGGFASAIALAVVALLMAVESAKRLVSPEAIRFDEAIVVAVIGLIVNLFSAFLLKEHPHDHGGDNNSHHHHHHHHDHNLRGAYLHVLADAMTSLLAIVALVTGKMWGWVWMDSAIGMLGAAVILHWSYGLLKNTSEILLDREVKQETISAIRSAVEADSDNRIADFHIWRVSSRSLALIVSVVTHFPKSPDHYKALLVNFKELDHVTIEVNEAHSEPCLTGTDHD